MSLKYVSLCLLLVTPVLAQQPKPVEAIVESTLPSAAGHIRQFAFDGNDKSYYASEKNPTKSDHFTLTFDTAVSVKSIAVVTGKPTGEESLKSGEVLASEDGKSFESIGKFTNGKFMVTVKDRKIKAIRIQPSEDLKHPLTIREFTVDSTPKVVTFKNPIEFTYDISDAPEMKDWIEKVIRICERQYPMICDELASPGFVPPTSLKMTLKSDYKGVAAAGGGRITGSVKFFKDNPNDIGAMVHETVHCVQNYKARGLPGWLVEGIADYVRFWKYEPGKAGKVNADRAKYDGSYRTTAAFLAFVSEKYDPKLVNKLNAQLRDGKYDVESWKKLTGKSVEELNQQWRESLTK